MSDKVRAVWQSWPNAISSEMIGVGYGACRAMLDIHGWKHVEVSAALIHPREEKPHGGIAFRFTLVDGSPWEVTFSGVRYANPVYELAKMAIFAAERLDAYLNLAPVPPHPTDRPEY